MKTIAKKKAIKKVKSVAKSAAKKAGVLLDKADVQAGKMAKKVKKNWKEGAPQREIYKKEMQVAAKKAGAKGLKMAKVGLKNSIKIGGDIVDVVKKDIKEMRKKK